MLNRNIIFLIFLHLIKLIRMKQIFLYCISFTLFMCNLCTAQMEWKSSKDRIVLPFEFSHNLIIVDVVINDVPLKMILDTGSDKNILFSFPENDSIAFYNAKKVKIKGVGYGNYLEAYISKNNILKSKELYDTNFEVLLVTDQDISIINKLGIPINGILGASFFKDFIVEINYQNNKIIFHKAIAKKLKKKLNKYKLQSVEIIEDKPYISLTTTINGIENEVKLLVDSGLGDGLWLFENDFIKCSSKYFVDVLGRGLGGDVTGKKSRVDNLIIQQFIFKEALVSYPDSLIFDNFDMIIDRNGSLGGEILKRFNWIIDYKNQQFYFKKNTLFNLPFHYNMSGIEIQHNGIHLEKELALSNVVYSTLKDDERLNSFKPSDYNYKFNPIYEIYAVRENSPAQKAGVLVGDKIISINGKNAYRYTIQKIINLFQSEEGREITIEVERKGKILKFKFQLEKIL